MQNLMSALHWVFIYAVKVKISYRLLAFTLLFTQKKTLTKTTYSSKLYNHRKFQEPILNGVCVCHLYVRKSLGFWVGIVDGSELNSLNVRMPPVVWCSCRVL
jgi:hypothetical protein